MENIDKNKIAEHQFNQNQELEEIHICSNGAVYRCKSDAEELQAVINPKEAVVTIKRKVEAGAKADPESAAEPKTAEELRAEITTLEEKIATLKGAPKAAVQKKLDAFVAELALLENKNENV